MPLYEYHCVVCERDCELLIRSSEKPVCPHCSSQKLQKLLSVTASPTISQNSNMACGPAAGPCGKPQCGQGGCMM